MNLKCRLPAIILYIFLLSGTNSSAQDWPNLSAYQQGNKELGKPSGETGRVVFMGNSITIGWLAAYPEFFEGKPYINRGIGGQTTPQMLLRFRQDVIDLQPKVVLILAGTNDIAGNTGPMSLEQILDNLKSMTELALANDIEPVLCSVLPATEYPWKPGMEPSVKIPALNSLMRHYARDKGIIYLDYYSAMVNEANGLDPELAEDGVHPTKAGYRIMGPLAEAAIQEALKKAQK
ncbi:SGNH/GDSL hydrolase family protein [Robiginitalea sp. IMCC44478]|uniref:SGNH/GDSL hydrolase family protein n=1 Tax=Robiginitalea sp. IMCC44478 TaxID=3459122 RepID=UPI0040437E6F